MTTQNKRRLIVGALAVVVVIAIVIGFLPESIPVETAIIDRGPLRVTVEEEGETHLEDRYVISAPADAYLRRIELEVGDSVDIGQPVAFLDPPRASDLDPRSREQAEARVRSAEAALTRAEEDARAAAAAAETAIRERERLERLHSSGSATRRALERAVADAVRATADRESASSAVTAARADLNAARAAISRDGSGTAPGVLRSPVKGRVLAVERVSAGPVGAGQELIELGDLDELEVRVDVLSEDAVRIPPGTRVLIERWGGEGSLEAKVRRVEPQGFTEVSSLGVEEQRVTVVARLDSAAVSRSGLGVGYRVLARFVIWEGEEVVRAPTAALFRSGEGWAAFVVEDGRAALRTVRVGHEGGLSSEVLDGLAEGERVIIHPGNELEHGTRVDPRDSAAAGR